LKEFMSFKFNKNKTREKLINKKLEQISFYLDSSVL